jgi:WD40 repeat protein
MPAFLPVEAMMPLSGCGTASKSVLSSISNIRSQNRTPIQVLEDAKDSITSIQIKNYEIITGSVDGKLRTYDLRAGQLSTDVVGRMALLHESLNAYRSNHECMAIIR